MRSKPIKLIAAPLLAFLGIIASLPGTHAQEPRKKWSPTIPKTWDDEALRSLEVPLATPAASPKHVSSEYYYQMPVRQIYKSYPVYYPGKEPAGYMAWLSKQEPQITFDASKLETEQDWIKAGEMVFEAPIDF